jgi:hypothetical protein
MTQPTPDVVVIASLDELHPQERIWGTGGWLLPERREALDWITLARCLGWRVEILWCTGRDLDRRLPAGARWVILACDPGRVGVAVVAQLAAYLRAGPSTLLSRAASRGAAIAALLGAWQHDRIIKGRRIVWTGPGARRCWDTRQAVECSRLRGAGGEAETWAVLDNQPMIVCRRRGRGRCVVLGVHPSLARDQAAQMTDLLSHLLVWSVIGPVAWLDLQDTLVLRMDDPGAAQNIHCASWAYRQLDAMDWRAIGQVLQERQARLSVGYVSGWVDDGDGDRGTLLVRGRRTKRIAGAVHPSAFVRYHDRAGHHPGIVHDYQSGYRGIQALRRRGLADVELHGYTHMHPDSLAWAKAPDRYAAVGWYRELGAPTSAAIDSRSAEAHPLALGVRALRRQFRVVPTTLICPGDQWTNPVLERALDLGLQQVSSYYLAMRQGDRFWWSTHLCAPYLDEPNAAWFASGLPVIGYFHDREPSDHGVGWLSRCLDRWQAAGARRFIDLRELAAALGRRVHAKSDRAGLHVSVTAAPGAPALIRPLRLWVRADSALPSTATITIDGAVGSLPVHRITEQVGWLAIPAPRRLRG